MTHTLGKGGRRRRCCECRDWYVAEASAAQTQRTCSKRCRLRRRARQEKRRREADRTNARADERERQRKYRARKRAEKGADPPLSQAGLSAQLYSVVEEILQELGHAQRRSQAGLRRRVRRHALKTLGDMCRSAGDSGHDRTMSLTGLNP
jgi:hypothetical protein